MIVDVHSHAWNFPADFSQDFIRQAERARPGHKVDLSTRYEAYRAAAPEDTCTIVFGGKARLSGLWTDDRSVAEFVAQDPERLIGYLSVDPTQDGWEARFESAMKSLACAASSSCPCTPASVRMTKNSNRSGNTRNARTCQVLLHTGTTFIAQAPLRFTQPSLIEPVALRHPGVKIILAHLGHPYEGDCIVTIRKHENVFADVSALHYRPWQLYNSLMLAQEYGFGTSCFLAPTFPSPP